MNENKYAAKQSWSGVAHVYFEDEIFCSVHHVHAKGISQAISRAEMIAELLNNVATKRQILPTERN